MDISSLRERRANNTLSVSELNGYIKTLFDNDRTLTAVSVKGEISNFIHHRSGHLYFSLKDEGAQIRAVMFRSSAERLKFALENGMRVVVRGSVTVYQRDGSYQIYVTSVEPDGVGALYLAYEQLKEKLSQEGLFDESYKKSLPEFPARIGVITSPTGAAVRDIINVLGRRYPLADVYLYPSLVQGEGAVDNLLEGLDYFEKSGLVDIVIIGRGGGSIEDLWAFNSESLARKIFSLGIPVISAVGHETDFTICDFVSDMRAPTPSAAAELAVPDVREIFLRVDNASERLSSSLIQLVDRKRERLLSMCDRECIKNPMLLIKDRRAELSLVCDKIQAQAKVINKDRRALLSINAEKLNALNPLKVLARGYSIAESNGKILKSTREVKPKDEILIRLSNGRIYAKVTEITKGKGVE
jgi:exodeoxyribonuclease VII large subunit